MIAARRAYRDADSGEPLQPGDRLGELGGLGRGGFDFLDCGRRLGDGSRLGIGACRLLRDGAQDGVPSARQALGAVLDFAGELPQLDQHRREGVGHFAELVLGVDRDGLQARKAVAKRAAPDPGLSAVGGPSGDAGGEEAAVAA